MKAFINAVVAYAANYWPFSTAESIDIPPLHYFAKQGNILNVEDLIIKNKVDINETYSYQGGEPVTALEMACKKGHADIIRLLVQNGAIDSYDLKILGHSLGLSGVIALQGAKQSYPVSYESLSEERTYPLIAHHIHLFDGAMQKGNLKHLCSEQFSDSEMQAVQMVNEAFMYYVETTNSKWANKKERYLRDLPVIIKCSWPNHSGFSVLYKDKLYISNKGGNTLIPSVSCYQINAAFLQSLSESDFSDVIKKISKKRFSLFSGNLSLPVFKQLNPKLIYSRRLSRQKQMNCTYSNIKRGVDVVLTALQDDHLSEFKSIDRQKIYQTFTMFDRVKSIDEYIQKYQDSPNPQIAEPLIAYLRDKSFVDCIKTSNISAYIIHRLKQPPFSFSFEYLAKRIQQLPRTRSKLWELYTLASRVEDIMLTNGKRMDNLKKIYSYLPLVGSSLQRKVLVQANEASQDYPIVVSAAPSRKI